jgi:hypothetical protein
VGSVEVRLGMLSLTVTRDLDIFARVFRETPKGEAVPKDALIINPRPYGSVIRGER